MDALGSFEGVGFGRMFFQEFNILGFGFMSLGFRCRALS